MILVEIKIQPVTYEITVAGHAGHRGQDGEDIVCAGVSALFMAICDAAEADGTEEDYTDGPEAKRVRLYRTAGNGRYLTMFRRGIEAIEREYPENVRLEGRRGEMQARA